MKADLPVPWPDLIDTRRFSTSFADPSHCCSVGVAPNASFANKAGPPARHRVIAFLSATASLSESSKYGRQRVRVLDCSAVFYGLQVGDVLADIYPRRIDLRLSER